VGSKMISASERPASTAGATFEQLETLNQNLHELVAVLQADAAGRGGPLPLDLLDTASSVMEETRQIMALVASEISEQNRAQELHSESLREKAGFVKEVHHRVKNNLQIIASLLNLQARSVDDGPCRAALRDSQNRIRALALIHDKLHSSEVVDAIPIREYIQDLTTALLRSLSPESASIVLDLDVADILLDLDAAIPVALILNELISNSLVHGFPGRSEGRVSVSFLAQSASGFRLSVVDDGVGVLDDLDFRNTDSLGLQMVCLLTKQLGGSIDLDGQDGTRCIIGFEQKGRRRGDEE
jgi:two-component sensor histidine kinase